MRSRSCCSLLAPVLAFAFALLPTPALSGEALTANDVCAADADPCIVAEPVRVAPGALLDFGTRTLSITGNGRLDFGSTSATIQAGDVVATSGRDVLLAAGPSGGQTLSGSVTILARRACSVAPAARPCVDLADCQLGACGALRCTGLSAKHCSADSDCVGACASGRCPNTARLLRCTTDADCDFGACNAQPTCTSDRGAPKSCATNADCYLGECSVGSGSILLEGNIDGMSGTPASVFLTAAGSLSMKGRVDLSATQYESDGGILRVRARGGDARIEGDARATARMLGYGGVVEVEAEGDAILDAAINLGGGDGELDVTAGRDAKLNGSVELSARSYERIGISKAHRGVPAVRIGVR